jgi:hypothetical protein
LHELNVAGRAALLQLAGNLLAANGEITLCDYSIPEKGIMKTIFPRLIALWEPRSAVDFLENGFYPEIKTADLTIQFEATLHHGGVRLIKLKPDAATR